MYTSGSCAAGYGTFAPGSRLVYRLSLGNSTPVGGVLTVTTCGLTTADTVLYLGTGCPTWFGSFNCLRGNDNASPGCGANALASSLSHVAVSSVYFVQVGAAAGGPVVSGLSWSYAAPSATAAATRSRSATPSRSRSRSATPSRSRTATATKSRSRKAKRV